MQEAVTSAPGSLALLIGIIDRPRATLAAVLANPRWKWLLPAIFCLAATALLLVLTAEELSQQAQRQQAVAMQAVGGQMQGLTDTQRAQLSQQMATFTSPLFLGLASFVSSGLGLLAGWLIGAAILYFGMTIGGHDLRYTSVVAGFSWTWLPFGLGSLVAAGWSLLTGKAMVNPGLSYFVSTGDSIADARNPAWVAAGLLDPFSLWHLVLVYCLVKAARPRRSAVGLTLVYALVYVALRVLPTLLATRLAFGA